MQPAPWMARHPAVFHITHHKAGSQWILAILRRIARPMVVQPDWRLDYLTGPLERGKVYPTAYITRSQFEDLELPDEWMRFIVIRDLRDAFVSAYWSLKLSHPEGLGASEEVRETLRRSSLHEGLLSLMPHWEHEADIVRSWVGVDEGVIRYEDLIDDDVGALVPLLHDTLGLAQSREQARKVIESARFDTMADGRKPGEEDVSAHQRKGVAGDWRNYIVGPIADEFKRRFGDVLIDTGYEKGLDW